MEAAQRCWTAQAHSLTQPKWGTPCTRHRRCCAPSSMPTSCTLPLVRTYLSYLLQCVPSEVVRLTSTNGELAVPRKVACFSPKGRVKGESDADATVSDLLRKLLDNHMQLLRVLESLDDERVLSPALKK